MAYCLAKKHGIEHGEITKILEDSRKVSARVQKKFNMEYSFARKELDAKERAISANAKNVQLITNLLECDFRRFLLLVLENGDIIYVVRFFERSE